MEFDNTLKVSAAGMKVQTGRMRVIAENVANADSTGTTPGSDAYRRKIPTVNSKFDRALGATVAELGKIDRDSSNFEVRYEPGHPAADASGMVKYPNVSPLVEMMDLRDAQRGYEANLNVVSSTRQMMLRTLDLLKG